MRVEIRRLARHDIDLAFDWYQERDEDTATAFLLEVDRVLERMGQNSEQFPVVYRDVRRALLKQFPYAIYFKAEGDHIEASCMRVGAHCTITSKCVRLEAGRASLARGAAAAEP